MSESEDRTPPEADARSEPKHGGLLVIGVGAMERGDDAAGRHVARRLAERAPDGFEVVEQRGETVELMDAWADARAVLLVDAMATGGEPGRHLRFDASTAPLPAHTAGASTHGMGIAEAVELARAMGSLPPRVIVYGIEGGAFEMGPGLSEGVARAIDRVANAVAEEARTLSRELADDA